MAHYLAELIYDAENVDDPDERALAREKCCEVILSLWIHRSSLPGRAKPLANLESVLAAIQSLKENQEPWVLLGKHSAEETDNPWGDFIKSSYCADRRMACIAALAAIAESSFDREKRWLDENSQVLSEDEAKIIHTLDSWLRSGLDWFTIKENPSVGELPPNERTDFILKELERSVLRQRKALTLLKKKLKVSK